MYQKKFFLIVFLLFTTFLIMANEIKTKPQHNFSVFSFNHQTRNLANKISLGSNSSFSLNKNIQYYGTASRGTTIALIVAGGVSMGVGFLLFLLPGIVVLAAYGILINELPEETEDIWDRYLLPAGVTLTIIGGLTLAAGIALLVVGLVLKAKSDGKIATFIESNNKNTQLGFIIKI